MSSALQRIGRALDRHAVTLQAAVAGAAAGAAGCGAIAGTEAALRAWLAGRGGERPARTSMIQALEEFQGGAPLRSRRQARLLSFGCVELDADGRRLIEDGERFVRLLDGLGDLPLTPREFRRCYRGLVRGYFDYDPQPASATGRHNWILLRDYLHRNVERMRVDGVVPRWVEALHDDREMLTADAGRRYIGSAAPAVADGSSESTHWGGSAGSTESRPSADLDGSARWRDGAAAGGAGGAAFERFRSALDIAPSSWLSRRVILACIDAACRAGDRRFVDAIDALVACLEQYPPLVDAGLARILERDCECHGAPPHQRLFDFALRQWGNPWSPSSDPASNPWALVNAASRAMVTTWLKLALIRQFFSLLGRDGGGDARRINFWQQYHLQIDDLGMALGAAAAADPRAEIAALRERMSGRLFELPASGGGGDALILCIGHHVIVEFGRADGACHVFDRASLPFSLAPHDAHGAGGPAGSAIAPMAAWGQYQIERLEHRDTRTENWENRFEKFMRTTVGVKSRPLADGPGGARS